MKIEISRISQDHINDKNRYEDYHQKYNTIT